MKVTSAVLAAFFVFTLGIIAGFFAFSCSLTFVLVAILPVKRRLQHIAACQPIKKNSYQVVIDLLK